MSYVKFSAVWRGVFALLMALFMWGGSASALLDNDGTCPVAVGLEDLAELWSATDFVRMDMNGATADCASALADYSLFAHDGIPDIVQLIMIQAAIEANVSLGGVPVAEMYQASADAMCGDFDYAYAEVLSGLAMISADSRDFTACAILALSIILTGDDPVYANTSDNPDAGFAYFAPAGDFDSDGTTNLAEWAAALATVGITETDVFTYDEAAWGLVWENAKRGGVGGGTAMEAFLASNGLALPQSLLFYPLANPSTAPPSVPGWQLRIAGWNIEFLNTRVPPRTTEQLTALAARMASLDAAVLCLQEIESKDVLEDVMAMMGSSYDGIYWTSQNAIVYDTTKVTLVDSALLSSLTDPPYSTYAADYPSATQFPFAPTGRIPVTAVFQSVVGSETFRVISFHGYYDNELCRQYEGTALNRYVSELLADAGETHRIFVVGDYNGQPGHSPEPELLAGGVLAAIPSENGEMSQVNIAASIDHISATSDALAMIPDGTLYVVRPRLYGDANREFLSTYSDHLPLLIEIGVTEPMPVASSWGVQGTVSLIMAAIGIFVGYRVRVKRMN